MLAVSKHKSYKGILKVEVGFIVSGLVSDKANFINKTEWIVCRLKIKKVNKFLVQM